MRRVRVGVQAPPSMANKIVYALEELLLAAGVPHCVEPTASREGWDLFYGDQPPEGETLWMAASEAARQFFEQPGRWVEQVQPVEVGGQRVRLPDWDHGSSGRAALRQEASGGSHDGPRLPPPTPRLLHPLRGYPGSVPDLAAAAFFFLARWEAWQATVSDRFGRFPLAASVFGRGLWSLTECPVESYAAGLRQALVTAPQTRWLAQPEPGMVQALTHNGRFAIGLSHDVDSIRRWDARGFARTGRDLLRALGRNGLRPACHLGTQIVWGVHSRLAGGDPHLNLQEVAALDQASGSRGTFYLIARHTHPWDGTHPGQYQRLLPSLARQLQPLAEVGLHASTAAVSAEELLRERKTLEALTGLPVRGMRFHNLRGGYELLPEVAKAGLEYDSSVAFAEAPGFAAGIARPFRPYDRALDRPLVLTEVPLAVMDTTLLSPRYLGLDVAAGREAAMRVLETVRQWNGAAAVLWHNDNLPPNEAGGYACLYSKLTEWVRSADGWLGTVAEIVDEWKKRQVTLRA